MIVCDALLFILSLFVYYVCAYKYVISATFTTVARQTGALIIYIVRRRRSIDPYITPLHQWRTENLTLIFLQIIYNFFLDTLAIFYL